MKQYEWHELLGNNLPALEIMQKYQAECLEEESLAEWMERQYRGLVLENPDMPDVADSVDWGDQAQFLAHDAAQRRVWDTPKLEKYEDILMEHWNDPHHYEWVASASLADVLDWAETIKNQEA